MQKNNSYNWFKNDDTKKSKRKIILNFLKIFIYLLLFVFSMTGCVQIWIIKTSNQVGRGVEFYSSEKEIAPHVTHFDVDYTTNKNKDELYSIKLLSKTQIWVSDKKELSDIHKIVQSQNHNNDLKMKDAFRGGNESFWITGKNLTHVLKKGFVERDEQNNPLVHSSVADLNLENKQNPEVINLNDLYIKKNDKENYVISFSNLLPIYSNEQFSIKFLNAFLNKQIQQNNNPNHARTIKEWLEKTLTLNTTISDEQQKSAYNFLSSLLDYAGIKKEKSDYSHYIKLTFQGNYIVGMGVNKKSDYRPIVTWGDAWKEGPFYGIFVFPIAWISANVIKSMGNWNGWETLLTIFFVVWLLRAITFMVSFKSILQQTKIQELNGKKSIIDAKYAPYKGNKQMENRQRQEVAELYRKEGVNPMSTIGSAFVSMPFFLAIWRTIGGLPHIKSTIWYGINFSATSWKELFAGNFIYLPLMILALFFAVMQQLMPRLLTKKRDKQRINVHQKMAMKKNNKMQNIMMIVFAFVSLIFQAGLQIYWIAGGIWMILQSYLTHRYFIWHSKNKKKKKIK